MTTSLFGSETSSPHQKQENHLKGVLLCPVNSRPCTAFLSEVWNDPISFIILCPCLAVCLFKSLGLQVGQSLQLCYHQTPAVSSFCRVLHRLQCYQWSDSQFEVEIRLFGKRVHFLKKPPQGTVNRPLTVCKEVTSSPATVEGILSLSLY